MIKADRDFARGNDGIASTIAYELLSAAYINLRDYTKAFNACNNGIKIVEKYEKIRLSSEQNRLSDYHNCLNNSPNPEICHKPQSIPSFFYKKDTVQRLYFRRSLIYEENLNNYKESLKDATKLISYDENCGIGYYKRGITYMKLKQYKKAIIDLEEAVSIAKINETKDISEWCLMDRGNLEAFENMRDVVLEKIRKSKNY